MRNFILFILATLGVQCSYCQNTIKYLVEHADKFNRVLPQEVAYLHIDNTGYFMNDTLWYKAYVMQSNGSKATEKSGVMYVELLDMMGDVIETRTLKLENGQAHGGIILDKLFCSGFYELRAYTRYQLNFGSKGIFSRVIPIFERPERDGDYKSPAMQKVAKNTMNAATREKNEQKRQQVNIDFYPEGGNTVTGKQSRIAFVVTDKDGNRLRGTCHLAHGTDTIAVTETDELGRGTVSYIPDSIPAHMFFTSALHDGKAELPVPIHQGCALTVDNSQDSLLHIYASPTQNLHGSKLGIVISHRGTTEYCDSFMVDGKDYTCCIDKGKLADGVNTITVFDTSGAVVAERMVFIYPRKNLWNICYKIKEKSILPYSEINVSFHSNVPNATFSVAVRDEATQLQGCNINAATYYLLSSELKGYIEHADYYLERDDSMHRRAADLLMLTQGWRRYDFGMQSGHHKIHLTQPTEKRQMLMGRIRARNKRTPVGGVDLGIAMDNLFRDVVHGACQTNAKGYYAFEVPEIWGGWDLLMRTSIEDKNKNYYIGINRNFSPTPRWIDPHEHAWLPVDTPLVRLNVDRAAILQQQRDARILGNVTIVAKKKGSNTGWNSTKNGEFMASIRYNCQREADKYADEGLQCPSLYKWLQEKNTLFAGTDNISGESSYTTNKYNFHSDGPTYGSLPILWYVNNTFLFATGTSTKLDLEPDEDYTGSIKSQVFPISIDEVRSVYITTDTRRIQQLLFALSADMAKATAVYVYTYNNASQKHKGLRYTHFSGFDYVIEPYFTQYPNITTIEPDFRRTLYWQPDVKTDDHGDADIKLYNNSSCTQIVISAEGITADGKVMTY